MRKLVVAQPPASSTTSPAPAARSLGSKIDEATIAPSGTFLHEAIRIPILIVALEPRPVKRIDVLFAIESEIDGLAPPERLRVRQERSRPLLTELQIWLREQRSKLSKNSDTTKASNYCLSRWDAFTRFLDDGRLCMSNFAAERELRAVAVGRRNWTVRVAISVSVGARKSSDAPRARTG